MAMYRNSDKHRAVCLKFKNAYKAYCDFMRSKNMKDHTKVHELTKNLSVAEQQLYELFGLTRMQNNH
ncbi:hypothetical protein A3F27_01315 [Candidatus Kaiserbacteria bacterium RIFCSPHIGHO2_12_FULL_53_13]|uniref:Uncharacterized protein n=1 Tax=Candidatus Kaiserbacteria bacterium RIFCSPHIGHO2_12_FULL_53_13 TaxID=1798502 RepID=A0A1F6E6P4_9BACT|nr:MAG: hypothetical protein A3F27_01315 [Candidatus Kaiserbacteria bacterium RIFCSPHIGHO2_12_FULL_53_13]